MEEFSRIQRLPPYVFAVVGDLKMKLRRQNIDIVDFSMGNPDIPTPPHIVDKLVEAAQKPVNHRYSLSRGIPHLRDAVCERYKRLYDVDLDPNTEAIVTMGSKEGLAHLSLAMLSPGDVVLAPDPTYPIHKYAPIIAGADVRSVPIGPGRDFFEDLTAATKQAWPRPKLLFLCYPHNPTTEVTDLAFFEKVVEFAKENNIRFGKVHATFMGGFQPCKYYVWIPDYKDPDNWHREGVAVNTNLTMLTSIGGMIGQRTIRGSDETEPFVAMHFVAGGGWDAPTITGHLVEGTLVKGCMQVFITELLDVEALAPVDVFHEAYSYPENFYYNTKKGKPE